MKEYILVTGGAGYIGLHTVVELVQQGINVVIVDNLVNSSYDAVARIEYIVQQKVPFFNIDVGDSELLAKVLEQYKISGVIHFAALKAVGESTQIPLDYYYNNVRGTISLLTVMKNAGVKTIVFSSSATVYGDATRFEDMIPIPEHCPTGPTNPYGRTKLMIEEILKDVQSADKSWRTAVLRYFNPIGAHPSGLIGEDPLGVPNNILPFLAQVAVGRREKLFVFGNDYDSHDGTPIRDYLHVVDLAKGHLAALNYLREIPKDEGLYREWNLGTGRGLTVFEVYNAFCKAIGRDLPYEVAGRRAGDVLNLTANVTRANTELKWKAELTMEDACVALWEWTTKNPFGFNSDNYKWELFNESADADYSSRLHTVKFDDFEVKFANYGALIQSVTKNGHQYVQGFDLLSGYKLSENPFFGTTVGRYANRIAEGKFKLDGKTFDLSKNENGVKCLHGGSQGFDKQLFLGPVVRQLGKDEPITMEFLYVDADNNNGFPAEVATNVRYTISHGSIDVEYEAQITKQSPQDKTAINLTNHSYFTLGGATIEGIKVESASTGYLAVDELQLPTGAIEKFPELKSLTLSPKDAYDHCLVIDKSGWVLDTRKNELRKIFDASKENRGVTFSSTEPAFQFYTGDGVNVKGREPRCGFCIEPGRYTNAVNNEKWQSQVVVSKGEVYGSRIRYDFR